MKYLTLSWHGCEVFQRASHVPSCVSREGYTQYRYNMFLVPGSHFCKWDIPSGIYVDNQIPSSQRLKAPTSQNDYVVQWQVMNFVLVSAIFALSFCTELVTASHNNCRQLSQSGLVSRQFDKGCCRAGRTESQLGIPILESREGIMPSYVFVIQRQMFYMTEIE